MPVQKNHMYTLKISEKLSKLRYPILKCIKLQFLLEIAKVYYWKQIYCIYDNSVISKIESKSWTGFESMAFCTDILTNVKIFNATWNLNIDI